MPRQFARPIVVVVAALEVIIARCVSLKRGRIINILCLGLAARVYRYIFALVTGVNLARIKLHAIIARQSVYLNLIRDIL